MDSEGNTQDGFVMNRTETETRATITDLKLVS